MQLRICFNWEDICGKAWLHLLSKWPNVSWRRSSRPGAILVPKARYNQHSLTLADQVKKYKSLRCYPLKAGPTVGGNARSACTHAKSPIVETVETDARYNLNESLKLAPPICKQTEQLQSKPVPNSTSKLWKSMHVWFQGGAVDGSFARKGPPAKYK